MTAPNPPTPARYAGPPTPGSVAARLGIPVERIVKLDANESPYGPPPAALAALAEFARSGSGAGHYPDAGAGTLRSELESYTGVAAERIAVGNGSDELIALLAELLLEPGDEVVVSEPTFGVYAIVAARRFAHASDAGRGGEDFTPDPERIAAAMNSNTRAVFLCGPNNPTGTPLPREALLAVLARAEELGRRDGPLVVLDEAYYEIGALGGDPDAWTAAPLVNEGRRLVVLRTFSKLFGLAGLRVGYALCPLEIASQLRERKQPFNVNSAGQVAAIAAFKNMPWLRERAVAILSERERLFSALAGFPGLRAFPSSANFLLVRASDGDATPLWEALLERGVMVRRFSGERLRPYLRITVGTPEQNGCLLAALTAIFEEAPYE